MYRVGVGFLVLALTVLMFGGRPVGAADDPHWTVEMARAEVFQQAERLMDVHGLAPEDPDKLENLAALAKGREWVSNRRLSCSKQGFYSVRHYSKRDQAESEEPLTLYYSSHGQLKAIEKRVMGHGFVKTFKYLYGDYAEKLGLQSGQLLFASLAVPPNEEFIFETTGRLHAHWLGDVCRRADGMFCFAQKPSEPHVEK